MFTTLQEKLGETCRRGRAVLAATVGLAAVAAAAPVAAAVTTHATEGAFQTAMDGGFTLINLDTFGGFGPGYRLDDAAPAAALAAIGVDSIGYNAQVVAGQNFQTPTNRDRLLDNGTGFGGLMAFNFSGTVNGLGAYSNNIDYGRIRIFSGANLTGTFLGEVFFGKTSAFGGIASDVGIGSAQFTCDFNGDLKCGVYDIQFGKFAPKQTGGVPEPGAWALMILGFGALGWTLRRRRVGAAALATVAAAVLAAPASAGVWAVDVTVTDPTTNFSFPLFSFTNASSGAGQISALSVTGGPPWDFVNAGTVGPYGMVMPAGATRTLVTGQETTGVNNVDDGGPSTIAYTFTGWDPGELFRFAADPEAANGTPDVIDIRPLLSGDILGITVSFAGGPTLFGKDWSFELIDPLGGTGNQNQRYRLRLSQNFPDPVGGVPEPGAWALMIMGFGAAGTAIRRRRSGGAAVSRATPLRQAG